MPWMLWSFPFSSTISFEQRVRINRLMELTLGALFLSQKPSWRSTKYIININCQNIQQLTLIRRSLISCVYIFGFSILYFSICFSISGVATRGLLPPMMPGRMLPVSWYRFKIFDTQPWDTRSCRLMAQGRTPCMANSMIFNRLLLGKGRPLIKWPPSWLTRPCPGERR